LFMIDYKVIEEKLGASIISDVLDGLGIRGQSMDTTIRPIADDMTVAGIAATIGSIQGNRCITAGGGLDGMQQW